MRFRLKGATPTEKVLQGGLLSWARKLWPENDKKVGTLLIIRKLSTGSRFGRNGDPDLLFFPPKIRPFLIEMKRQGEDCTDLQLEMHRRYRALGYDVYVVDNLELGKKIIMEKMRRALA